MMIKEKENGETEIKESKTNIVKNAKKGFSKLALLASLVRRPYPKTSRRRALGEA